jgi:RNA polymerase sigma-70 factor (ECF subfamily)
MANDIDSTFLNLINQNLGIAHKIARVYFDDPPAREDAVQEMMYQLWRSFKSFDNRSKFSTWMYRVCLNTALTHFSKAKRTQWEPLAPHHQNIPDIVNTGDEINTLLEAIGSLSKLNRAIVLLYLEGMSYDEIASVTGLSHGNVSVRLFRIRKELEAFVKRQNN